MSSVVAATSARSRQALSDGVTNLYFRHTNVRVRAITTRSSASRSLHMAQAQTQCGVVERVLRYPDGHVRTIRYPEPSTASTGIPGMASVDAQAGPASPPSPSGDWHICSELDDSCAFDPGLDLDLPGAAPVEELWGSRRGYGSQQSGSDLTKMPKLDSKPVEEFGSLPSSPAALLEYLSSDMFASERQKLLEKVENSFEVLHGCPWLKPKSLITVAVRKEGAPHLSSYTLPVAVEQEDAGEMSKVLKMPHLEKALKVRKMKDGVIAFDCDMAAAEFLDSLHEAGSLSATLTEVDSHELFRATADAKAAVVLVCGEDRPSLASTSGEEIAEPKYPGDEISPEPVCPDETSVEPSIERGVEPSKEGSDTENNTENDMGAEWPSVKPKESSEEEIAEWPRSAIYREHAFVPTPAQLAAALRGKDSVEDW